MKSSASISSLVFDELLNSIELLGVDNTIKTLKEARSKKLILGDLNIDFVINSVSEVTGVSKEMILYGTERTDERKIALALCVYYIKNEFSYSYSDLNKIFKKDESGLSKYNSMVQNLPKIPKTEFDKTMFNYSKKLDLIITERKLKK